MVNKYYSRKPLTTAELLEEIERLDDDDHIPTNIYITPPADKAVDSDADSGEEDCNDPDKLNRNQLEAEAEADGANDDDPDLEIEFPVEDIPSVQDQEQPPKKRKKALSQKRDWTPKLDLEKGMTNISDTPIILPPITLSEASDPIQFFEMFLSASVVEHIVKHTVMYASQKNCKLELGNDEMYVFIGILFLSGYISVPRRSVFWENREDSHNELAATSMRRNRFEEIFRFLHVVDNNNLDQNDKMTKLRPLMDSLNNIFTLNFPPQATVSVDEFGRHGCKQYIKGKPIRFGYKAWVAAASSGYCISFDIYQGRRKGLPADATEEVGLGESVVLTFAKILKDKFETLQFSLFFDNFFTNAKLITKLGIMGFGGTGTVRENRTDKCPLENKKAMKKRERGVYDYALDKENNIIAAQWHDNSVVIMMSNEFGVEPLQKAKRYSAKEKSKIDLPQPNVISQYNKYMGGVDLMDRNIAQYRIGFRGKKWYMPILLWMFDVCLNNAWLLSRLYGKKLDNLEFRRQVVLTLLKKYGQRPRFPGPSGSSIVQQSVRSSGQHLIVCGQKRLRCAVCKNKTTKACDRCNVPLHDKCFFDYHK